MAAPAAFDAAADDVEFAASVIAVASSVVADAFEAFAAGASTTVAAPDDAHAAAALAVAKDGPPLPLRIVDRSSLAKLELRVEK